jgi:acetoin utilization deacetylase AcuC-like enzyme
MNLLPFGSEMVITLENSKRTILEKDQRFLYIQEMIEQKRNLLMQKQYHLKKAAKQNHFLEVVKNDYVKYYEYISQQKREQIKAFELLNKYIQDLNTTNKLSKYNMEDAKAEQDKIMCEIGTIRKGLDKLMTNTDKLGSLIK